MRELLRRSITGVIYVVLLLGTVFLSSDAFDFLFMAFGLACLYEYKRIVHLKGYYLFAAYLALWWVFIYLTNDSTAITILMLLTITVDVALLMFLFSKKPRTFTDVQKFVIGLFYVGGGCIFLTMIPYKSDQFAQFLIMGIFILIWVNDTFAYLVGRLFGRTKLFPSVSPKKTIEGSVGGLIFALVAAYFLSWYETRLSIMEWMIMAGAIVVAGSLGDLLESKFKRMAGVKDSGAILPGHGGIWDRLDSLVFAAPFAYLILTIFPYVS
ncbi:phosphatidate cytidylyltransferase [Flagellimonas zhangzhouensis]|uniref:Phosphatidate cytidylyltransferase n=1 Tax=Flagellimonas zhangzhouensis TaxID=1073328 RepID=A0A1H2YXT4_9FLAO|nr:phosphatidate cytidylyltransferase [Allomuricauda zhangzhouensis]SDR04964.1 phosphatidate cytidylyltransferase [Allomuricauda zhangzhouensis]SDX09973.1 phosphatidate cytidylyltransferase [Allomuricauda zhangzhouensis]